MPDASLLEQHGAERSRAIRELLVTPILDVDGDQDRFGLVVRHHEWLTDWFEATCGWQLSVDIGAGFARLAKRSARPDPTRPLRRLRGNKGSFDRRRFQLLCLICAELVRRPVTTIGLLAQAIPPDAGFDTSRRVDRTAFVDSLLALDQWGVVRASAGSVDAFVDDERGNAILTADTARLHRLLVSTNAPSGVADSANLTEVTEALLAEPRYGDAARDPGTASEDQRLRWTRHNLARRVLDDPVVLLDDLSQAEQDYLVNPSGRRWLRDRIAEAGLELEERAEGVLAIDPDAIATDLQFPSPQGNTYQIGAHFDRPPGQVRRRGPAQRRRALAHRLASRR